jgi:hypothetical protein
MPALNAPPLETAVPGSTRRRLWKPAELKSHSLLVLTMDELRLAPLSGPPRAETVAAVEDGGDLDDLLGPLATAVELASVHGVKLDLLTNTVVLDYSGAGRGGSRLTVVFTTPEAADACFTRLWRRLGEGCELLPYRRDTWTLAKSPLSALAAVLLTTLALALGLGVYEEATAARTPGAVSVPPAGEVGTPVELPGAAPRALPEWFTWRTVCGIGGVAAALSQVWLYRRLTQPPVRLELIRN